MARSGGERRADFIKRRAAAVRSSCAGPSRRCVAETATLRPACHRILWEFASWHPLLMRRWRMYDHVRLFARLLQVCASDPSASLRVMSRRLGVHPHTLAHVVRERTGASFSAWRAHRRVSESCRLLRTRPELSIKEIAAASGFSATSVFDRFLRRACGRSPSECRSSRLDASVSQTTCADRREPIRRSRRAAGGKVNVLADASTIDGVHPSPPGATLESGRRVISTETSRSPT